MRRAILLACLGLTAAVCLGGCGDDEKSYEFAEVRELENGSYRGTPPMPSGDRFGFRADGMPGGGHGDPHGSMGQAPEPKFTWSLPAGWENLPASGMRKGSWRVAGDEQTDCSLTMLQGVGGGLLANVNRWRAEMGLEPTSEDEAQKLASRTLFERPATYIDLAGNFSGGRGGKGAVEGARMLGLVLSLNAATIFLKFTGPANVVTANKEAFEALADSLQVAATTPEPHAGAVGGAPGAAEGYAFETPSGWALQPAKMMRIATFIPDDDPASWCYASQLAGDAGGLDANVNRWRREMGQGTLDSAAIQALPKLEVLGTQAPLLDLTGDFAGTGGPSLKGARMYGIVCERGDHVIFVKMVGPADTLPGQRERFVQFCTSLQEK